MFDPAYCARNPSFESISEKRVFVQDVTAAVTVRTAGGSTYAVTVQVFKAEIKLGDSWPPK